MVNMFSMGSMSSMGGMYSQGGNIHQNLKNKYGVGYEDFNSMPYAQPYPFATTPIPPKTACQEFWLCKFLKKYFS